MAAGYVDVGTLNIVSVTHGCIIHNNLSKRMTKERNKQKKKAEVHADLQENTVGLNDTTNTTKTSIRWQRAVYRPLNLYPEIPLNQNDNPTRRPTPAEVQQACYVVDMTFFLLNTAQCVITDPLDRKSIIAIIEFTPWDQLTDKDKEDLNFLSTFLHGAKEFINPVSASSRSWGGKMWAIGWRKSQDFMQIVGRYIKKLAVKKLKKYDEHFTKSYRAGEIIGHYFREMASIPFKKNQTLMEKFNIPSFDSLRFQDKPGPLSCSPHLTFTTNGFFNPPHVDSKDISEYAFVLFLPTYSATGKLAPPDSGYDVKGGPFVFPDHKLGINFDHQHGIVKMVWQAKKYKHCTLPYSSPSSTFTRLGMSLQINLSLANACKKEKQGNYSSPLHYFGDHFYYMFRCLGKGSLLAAIFFFHFFFM